jgi:hypothetical protein
MKKNDLIISLAGKKGKSSIVRQGQFKRISYYREGFGELDADFNNLPNHSLLSKQNIEELNLRMRIEAIGFRVIL